MLFLSARTHRAWLDHPVSDDILRKLYDLLRVGLTGTNCCPGRFVFVRSKEAKERLAPALNPANLDRTMTAPVTVIVATVKTVPIRWLTGFVIGVTVSDG